MDLIGFGAVGGDVAFHQRCARGLAETQQRAGEHRRRHAAAGDMDDMQGLREHGTFGDLEDEPVRHHRAVQRHHGIGVIGREQLRLQRRIAAFQHLAKGADAKTLFRIGRIGQFRRKYAVNQHQPAHASIACSFRASPARFSSA